MQTNKLLLWTPILKPAWKLLFHPLRLYKPLLKDLFSMDEIFKGSYVKYYENVVGFETGYFQLSVDLFKERHILLHFLHILG